MKIMTFGPITSWQIDGKTMETLRDLFWGAPKSLQMMTSMKLKEACSFEKKIWQIYTNFLKAATLLCWKKFSIIKAMIFPVIMYRFDRWAIKNGKQWRIDRFELWCWTRLLRVPWTARRSNQSILKEINPEYSLEGLMLKLNLQYFGQ